MIYYKCDYTKADLNRIFKIMELRDLINEQLTDMLTKKRLGKKWGLTKAHIIELAKIRLNQKFKPADVTKAINQITGLRPLSVPAYKFLMKTSVGYCFPENEKEWKNYALSRHKMASGLMVEANHELGMRYELFLKTLN